VLCVKAFFVARTFFPTLPFHEGNGYSAGLPEWFIFEPKIPILAKFWMILKWKVLVCFTTFGPG
jgi:hypothetical protein